jgi:hypothetical protein
VQPDFNVEPIAERPGFDPDNFGEVRGYDALYNFRQHFWVAQGSRVYGPEPHLTLNHSQNLYCDVELATSGGSGKHALLIQLLSSPFSSSSSRVFTAIRWFNDANREGTGEDAALVSLAIAFESLLGLPQTEKTDRLVDAIALLLGRVPRLDTWANQFYRARSAIVHEGRTNNLRFIASDSFKSADGPIYQSLLSYGIRIFRLCLSTLLVGADLAHKAGLEDILVTNQQRFKRTCEILSDKRLPAFDRLTRIIEIVEALDRYRFLSESGLQLETMLGAIRLAVEAVVECDAIRILPEKDELNKFITSIRDQHHLKQLEAVKEIEAFFASVQSQGNPEIIDLVRKLIGIVWTYTFSHYYWLKQQGGSEKSSS